MKIHVCQKGGFLHNDLDAKQEEAWFRLPESLREDLVRVSQRIDDLEEREGFSVMDTPRGRTLLAEKDRAIAALVAHPASHGVSRNEEWFRLFALVEAQARSDRCVMCYRRMNQQLSLAVPTDPELPQDDPPPPPPPPPPPRSTVALPSSVSRNTSARPPQGSTPTPAPTRHDPPWAPRPAEVMPTAEAARLASEAIAALKNRRPRQ